MGNARRKLADSIHFLNVKDLRLNFGVGHFRLVTHTHRLPSYIGRNAAENRHGGTNAHKRGRSVAKTGLRTISGLLSAP